MSDLLHGGHRINGRAIWVVATIAAAAAMVALTGCDLGPKPDLARGQQLFTQKCGSCHTLTAAGTTAQIGPNLDYAFKEARANGQDPDTFEGAGREPPPGHAGAGQRVHAPRPGQRG